MEVPLIGDGPLDDHLEDVAAELGLHIEADLPLRQFQRDCLRRTFQFG